MHCKEFNLAHAKAGAPVMTREGGKVRNLIFDLNHPSFPIGGYTMYFGKESPMLWDATGCSRGGGLDLVMAPVLIIDNKPAFVDDEVERYIPETLEREGHWYKHKVLPSDGKNPHKMHWPQKQERPEPIFSMGFIEIPDEVQNQIGELLRPYIKNFAGDSKL